MSALRGFVLTRTDIAMANVNIKVGYEKEREIEKAV